MKHSKYSTGDNDGSGSVIGSSKPIWWGIAYVGALLAVMGVIFHSDKPFWVLALFVILCIGFGVLWGILLRMVMKR